MSKNKLINRKNKDQLINELLNEKFVRKTCSFYRYVIISDPEEMKTNLNEYWLSLNILGRVYIAKEGINAQISIPITAWDKFLEHLYSYREFANMHIKSAIVDDHKSFIKLKIKLKEKIVADGLEKSDFDFSEGKYLSAEEFNLAMDDANTVVVDVRNYYESEVGHFKNAICPDVDTFREALPAVKQILSENKNKKILLYCTGGIRCEKVSAYLKQNDFKNVYQLNGGIIEYAHQINKKQLKSKFIGRNFVFDSRLSEPVTDDIISVCHQCDFPADIHTNCKNQACHILFIQCSKCSSEFNGCCSKECDKIARLPINKQKILRKDLYKAAPLREFQQGVKPKLKELIQKQSKSKK